MEQVSFFKNLMDAAPAFYNIHIHDITPYNFRISTDAFVFPSFGLNKFISLNTILGKINVKSFDRERIIEVINNLSKTTLIDSNESGLIFFGIYKNHDNLYACVSSQRNQDKLIEFYERQALNESVEDLEVRYNLIKKFQDPSLAPETFNSVLTEYDLLKNTSLHHLLAHRFNYLDSLKTETERGVADNLFTLNAICEDADLELTNEVYYLDHVSIKDRNIKYFVTELQSQSLVFYNYNEGFGLLQNNNEKAFLIPSAVFSNQELKDELNIDVDVYESSICARRMYNNNKFVKRDEVLKVIDDYRRKYDYLDKPIVEKQRFLPMFLYLC